MYQLLLNADGIAYDRLLSGGHVDHGRLFGLARAPKARAGMIG
jgi:hypothetical protein